MTLDDRLRRALQTYRDDLDLTPDAIERIQERATIRTRRDQNAPVAVIAGVVVMLLAIAVVGVGVWMGQDRDDRQTAASTRTSHTVAAFGDGSIRILNAKGEPTRTLFRGFLPPEDGRTVAVSPDGQSVYFDRLQEPASGVERAADGGPGCGANQVARVSIRGGVPNFVAYGVHPAISPDGRYLAVGLACSSQLVVWDLHGGGFSTPGGAVAGLGRRIVPVAWSPDGRTLLVRVIGDEPGIPPTYWLVATAEGGATQPISIDVSASDVRSVTGFYGSTEKLVASTSQAVVVLDAQSAQIDETLFRVPGAQHAAAVLFNRARDAAQVFIIAPPDFAGMYQWKEGQSRARRVVSHWRGLVESASPVTQTRAFDRHAPATYVVVRGERLQVRSTSSGKVVRTLVPRGVLDSAVSVTSDGRRVYFNRIVGREPVLTEDCDRSGPEVWSVPVTGGRAVRVGYGYGPQISPDGSMLATQLNACGALPSRLVITNLDRAGNPTKSGVVRAGDIVRGYPQSWSSDSSHLLYDDFPPPSGPLQTFMWNRNSSEVASVPLPEGAQLALDLGDTGYVAAVVETPNRSRVIAVNPETGEIMRTRFTSGERIQGTLRTDASGRHFLFVTQSRAGDRDRLWRWSPGDQPVVLTESRPGEGLTAAWVE